VFSARRGRVQQPRVRGGHDSRIEDFVRRLRPVAIFEECIG